MFVQTADRLIYHTKMELLNLLNDKLTRHNRKDWDRAVELLERFFRERVCDLVPVMEGAQAVREKIGEMDAFIQTNTAEICPQCLNICCINTHGYYDYQDLIYIYALGLRGPVYREGIKDTDPCQFIAGTGCTIARPLRPFRCNWYFCNPLLAHIENGPARPYREFIALFHDVIALRKEMLDEFFRVLSQLVGQSQD